jgi:5-hydroxyisourate hydrolase
MISTHILDTSLGKPAADVTVRLEKKSGDRWTTIATEKTNSDGRISFSLPPTAGSFQLTFQVRAYFEKLGIESFFEDTQVAFSVNDTGRKYHVPLLLNPFGYSTYRGS